MDWPLTAWQLEVDLAALEHWFVYVREPQRGAMQRWTVYLNGRGDDP